ncbi:MAG: glycosyltransferase family 4 protein [Nevskia sp.]|nr:glycosyltransferase family 4 protein [Nevskia sp.]
MRIAYQSDGYLPDVIGGVEVFSDTLIAALRARGHEVLVLTSCIGDQPPGRYDCGGPPIYKFRFGEVLLSNRLAELSRLQNEVNSVIAAFDPDLLHVNDARASSFFMVRRGALRAMPRLLTLHSPIRPSHREGLLKRLVDDADRVVAVSQFVAGSAAADIPTSRGKIEVIANALPPPRIAPAPLPSDPVVLLCLGRVIEDKGMHSAIEALALLGERARRTRLLIAGDGPYLETLQALVAARGLDERVVFTGWLLPGEVAPAINLASIVLVPSIWEEAFGLVALEAAQMGRPVIATRTGGLPEVVQDGITGLLVPPDDPAALAEAIALLIGDAQRMARMAAAASAHAGTAHNFSRFVSAYEAAYRSICGRNSHALPA